MRKSRSNTAKDTVIMSNKSLKVFLVFFEQLFHDQSEWNKLYGGFR